MDTQTCCFLALIPSMMMALLQAGDNSLMVEDVGRTTNAAPIFAT